jgi:hypothetical protein
MSIRQNLRPRLHVQLRTATLTTALALALCGGLAHAQTKADTLGLTQVLEAARNNFDVSLSRQSLEAAKSDVLAADRAPFPVFTAKTSQMYLDNGVNGNQGVGPGPFGQKTSTNQAALTGLGNAAANASCAPKAPTRKPMRRKPICKTLW